MKDLIRQKIIDSIARPIPAFTRRDVRLPKIADKVMAVIGMRRTGKTTFLWQIISDRVQSGLPREGSVFFGFEDERLAGLKAEDLHILIEEYYRLYPERRDRQKTAFFFDEIQAVAGWESFVRRILDTEKVDIFISGSSARLLSREVATNMRGRALEALVHPFSFREYLRHRGREPNEAADRRTKASRAALEKDLRDYLACGGFPEAQNADLRDRQDLLRGYVDTTLFRDIIERHEVKQVTALRWMARHLLGNPGGSFSVAKFYKDIKSQGLSITKDTLYDLFSFLEDAFLVRVVSLHTGSERRRMVNPRKIYPVDPGLIPLYSRNEREDLGHALETCVLIELERRGARLSYVRTEAGHEVDFLALFPDNRRALIQVCVDLSEAEVRDREIRALIEAGLEIPRAEAWIITLNPESARNVPSSISVRSAAEWLLS